MAIGLSDHFGYKKLIRFTIPTIVMMIFTSLYVVVDGIFVSNCVGSDAFAAINIVIPFLMILASVGYMFGVGGCALVSRTFGEGDDERGKRYFSMLIYLLIIIGLVFTTIGYPLIRPISVFLGADNNMLSDCVVYGKLCILFLVPFMLQNAFQSFFVAAEKPKLGLLVTVLSGCTNMVLDFVFVYLLDMGVLGAALATGMSQIVGGVIPLLYFVSKNTSRLKLVKTKFEFRPIIHTLTNGASEMVADISISLTSVFYNMQLMKYSGADGVAVYGVILYISYIFIGTFLGYSIGSAPILSFNFGAKNIKELKNVFKKSMIIVILISLSMTVLSELTASFQSFIFVGYNAELMNMATKAVRLYSLSYVLMGINIYASALFTALSNGLISAIIAFSRTFLFQTIMIFILPLILGINGIWLASVFAELISFAVSLFFIIRNKNKYHYI